MHSNCDMCEEPQRMKRDSNARKELNDFYGIFVWPVFLCVNCYCNSYECLSTMQRVQYSSDNKLIVNQEAWAVTKNNIATKRRNDLIEHLRLLELGYSGLD
jgi:hypothetical protein